MPEESFQEKTEQATPKKKEEARKKGQVAKSKELSSVAVLSAGLIYLFFGCEGLTRDLGEMVLQTISDIPRMKYSDFDLMSFLIQTVENYLWMLLPIMLTISVAAILINLAQTGFIWSVESLAPKASKINPIEGGKRILSKKSLAELIKSIAKMIIIGWAAYSTLKDDFNSIIPLIYQEKGQIMSLLGHLSFKVSVKCCWVIAIMAILDYFYQRWEHGEKLKMTKQEVKDEFKQAEGDPHVKARVRSIQREMAKRRMMEEIPKADVVITNPVRLAIAVSYNPEHMSAPVITAKGAQKIARRIKEIAMENHIPLVENRLLAQNLYKLDIGEEIPPLFYQAVAEILAYVYGLKKKRGINFQ